jgi:hypothetical protein
MKTWLPTILALTVVVSSLGCTNAEGHPDLGPLDMDVGAVDADSADFGVDASVDAGPAVVPRLGEVGTRCTTAGTCDIGLECRGDFFYERRVCTKACTGAGDCPAGTVCVENIPDFNATLIGPFCLRPCVLQPECAGVLGSDCDTYSPLTARYCF